MSKEKVNMDVLFDYHRGLLRHTNEHFYRFLYGQINWDQRMIAVKGPRGTGKTTMLLQRIKYGLGNPKDALYVTADHPWFYNHTLLELAEQFVAMGGKWLFVDEVHKYPMWARELKTIYDGNPQLKLVISASSALDIYRGEADLSRRLITYNLPGMSLREYIALKHKHRFDTLQLGDLIANHEDVANKIVEGIKPLPLFKEYLESGYYPYSLESGKTEYFIKINQTITAIIEGDLAAIEGYSAASIIKLKKLLGVIAESAPFQPNISAISQKLGLSRDYVYLYLKHLENAKLLNFVSAEGKGVSTLQKPDKIYLENPNISYTLRSTPDKGNLRETFLLNQLLNAHIDTTLPKNGDFMVDQQYTLEVGGKSKTGKQLKGAAHAYIVADDLEVGFGNKIPLWLFGFLY